MNCSVSNLKWKGYGQGYGYKRNWISDRKILKIVTWWQPYFEYEYNVFGLGNNINYRINKLITEEMSYH